MTQEYSDIYIKYEGHPKFNSDRIIEDDIVETIVQKLEMILFTTKGSLYGNPDLGCNLEYLLWSTKIPTNDIRNKINEQIITYVPELDEIGYDFNIELFEGTFRDILYLNFIIKGYNYQLIIK